MGKWPTIKYHKANADAKKAGVFTKIAREIAVAARQGADPAGNFQLRTAIDKAKAAGIPNDNIDRAIAKGSGTGVDAESLANIRYEGYGPGGVALIIEALTDNRTRTVADLRMLFNKYGGNLGEVGCVGFMFEQKGVVELRFELTAMGRGRSRTTTTIDEDALLEACIDGGADTYEWQDSDTDNNADQVTKVATVFTDMTQLEALTKVLQAANYTVATAEFRWLPLTTVEVTDLDQARSLLKLIDRLEDLDDVQTVTSNWAISDALWENLNEPKP
jgi:YebC/PmpR family DNA-binding regulatory protein